MRVAITGSHGLIGSALAASLEGDGHIVIRLVRATPSGPNEAQWDPAAGTVAAGALDGVDAVVHLAGEGVAEKRWSDEQKARIRDSRVNGTKAIAHACATATDGPRVLVSGSAVGYYGATGDTVTDESGAAGSDFLAGVVADWEAAAAEAKTAGVRVVHPRTGVVQSANSGMLKQQLLPFKLGVGGKVGDGKFWMSWISLDDEVRALRFLVDNEAMSGPVNLTAPNPVRNVDYAKALGAALHRPALLTVPTVALKAAMSGELVEALLASQRVVPKKLLDAGFTFNQPTILEGLRSSLKA